MRKYEFFRCENKGAADKHVNARSIGSTIPLHFKPLTICGRTAPVPVCVGPGQKPRRQVSSCSGSSEGDKTDRV